MITFLRFNINLSFPNFLNLNLLNIFFQKVIYLEHVQYLWELGSHTKKKKSSLRRGGGRQGGREQGQGERGGGDRCFGVKTSHQAYNPSHE